MRNSDKPNLTSLLQTLLKVKSTAAQKFLARTHKTSPQNLRHSKARRKLTRVVLALSFFRDPAGGLDTIFLVFTAVLLTIVPLVLLIPEPGAAAPVPARPAATALAPAKVGSRSRDASA